MAAHLSAEALRAALKNRCSNNSPDGPWRAAATAAGVSGADAFLCHSSRSIAAALESLAAASEAARTCLHAVRETVRAELMLHVDELEESIAAAQSFKRTALERELCNVDTVLERLRVDRSVVAEAVASLGDAELVARNVELMTQLDSTDALILALPTTVIELPYVGLVIDESALSTGIPPFGRVIAPRAVVAADLALVGAPGYTWPGDELVLRLAVQNTTLISQTTEELEMSLSGAVAAIHVEATLESPGAEPQPLLPRVTASLPSKCVVISIGIPVSTPVESSVCLGRLTLSGQPVAGLLGPLRVEVGDVLGKYWGCPLHVTTHYPSALLALQRPGPTDLSPDDGAQLQAWLPPGGSTSPGSWKEVYRATIHGFGAAAFHARCDGQARLLVLIRGRGYNWRFGGFTAEGFSPPVGFRDDPAAFLFSLTNSLGRPEKLASKQTGNDLYYSTFASAIFSNGISDLYICDDADKVAGSYTLTGHAYEESASTGAHPMAQGRQQGWVAAEIVAWVV